MKNYWLSLLYAIVMASSCSQGEIISESPFDDGKNLSYWDILGTDEKEFASIRTVYHEQYGEGNPLRLNQSMSIHDDKIFCFSDGTECHVFDFLTGEKVISEELPDYSHHNNAQFLDTYFDHGDEYPILLLSKGNYPPTRNDALLLDVTDKENTISFSIRKTIHCSLRESSNNGSWVVDSRNCFLFLYTMDNGDYRVTEGNRFCIFKFKLPNCNDSSDVTLGYEDIVECWKYSYLVHQGGTFYKDYLFFNVQGLQSVNGDKTACSKCVLAVNSRTGKIDAYLPLYVSMETEGICVYNGKLYISFRNGSDKQKSDDIVFFINEYSLPTKLFH